MKLNIPIGTQYHRLVVIGEGKPIRLPGGQLNRTMKCRCDCGNVRDIRVVHLTRGRYKTCGCTKHGGYKTQLHNTWRGMLNRCTENYQDHHIYYDRGISVCDEWKLFVPFKRWAIANGWAPGLEIDRKENDKGYFPDNCRFVTPRDNVNNRRVTRWVDYNGTRRLIIDLVREVAPDNVDKFYKRVLKRIKQGWAIEKAINTPVRVGKY